MPSLEIQTIIITYHRAAGTNLCRIFNKYILKTHSFSKLGGYEAPKRQLITKPSIITQCIMTNLNRAFDSYFSSTPFIKASTLAPLSGWSQTIFLLLA